MKEIAMGPRARKAFGEVTTRRWVVDSILDLTGYVPEADLARRVIVEPAVGTGAFLGAIVERLMSSAARWDRGAHELFGALLAVDIRAENIEASRQVVRSVLSRWEVPPDLAAELARTWVRQGDFLLEELTHEADFVVGNPPYIRSDDLDDDIEKQYRDLWPTMRGRADIYVGFYEHGLGLLREGGKLGFICADRWMRNAYGTRLRRLIATRFCVEAVWLMHDVDAFEQEVSAYPAVTIISRQPQASAVLVQTSSRFGPQGARQARKFLGTDRSRGEGAGWSGARFPGWFGAETFWPAGEPETIRVLERLRRQHPLLEADGRTRVGVGVATGADRVFIVPRTAVPEVEEDRVLPLVMSKDIATGSLETPDSLLLNPWDDQGKLVRIDDYPGLREALTSDNVVQDRYVARKNPAAWHRTIDKVHPGLAQRPKLLFQDMKSRITPVLEPGGYYPHHNLYYVVSDAWDLEVLGGLLLSRVAESFISTYGVRMRGGTLRFQAQYLRQIAVPDPDMMPADIQAKLRSAFRAQDRDLATEAAEEAYGLPVGKI